MEALVLAPLDAIENALGALVSSITTTQFFTNAPTAAKEILSADDALTSALTTLKQHQNNYVRILRLQAEASRLQEELKTVVRTCGALRKEIRQIHPSIVEESDSEDEESARVKPRDIDYKTLLAFAARIGKHNAVAAREAEQEALRRRLDARKTQAQSQANVNGDQITAAAGADASTQPISLPEESRNDLELLNSLVAADRAAKGMAFPAAESLRLGLLGQLQLIREEGGEGAVEKEVERLIRAADGSAGLEEAQMEKVEESLPDQRARQQSTTVSRPSRPSQSAPIPAAAPRKITLDLWNEDEDDDD